MNLQGLALSFSHLKLHFLPGRDPRTTRVSNRINCQLSVIPGLFKDKNNGPLLIGVRLPASYNVSSDEGGAEKPCQDIMNGTNQQIVIAFKAKWCSLCRKVENDLMVRQAFLFVAISPKLNLKAIKTQELFVISMKIKIFHVRKLVCTVLKGIFEFIHKIKGFYLNPRISLLNYIKISGTLLC